MHGNILVAIVRMPDHGIEMHGPVGRKQPKHDRLPTVQGEVNRHIGTTVDIRVGA
jgi:hypothetical protein